MFIQKKIKKEEYFNDNVKNKIITLKKNDMDDSLILDIATVSKEKIDGESRFNEKVFDTLKNIDTGHGIDNFMEIEGENEKFNLDGYINTMANGLYAANEFLFENIENTNEGLIKHVYQQKAVDAFNYLIQDNVIFKSSGTKVNAARMLIGNCIERTGGWAHKGGTPHTKFNNEGFQYAKMLIDKGAALDEASSVMDYMIDEKDDSKTINFSRIDAHKKLAENGLNIKDAAIIAAAAVDKNGQIDENKIKALVQLNKEGLSGRNLSVAKNYVLDSSGEFNEIAYDRLSKTIKLNLPVSIIQHCKDKGVFSDRLYRQALDLIDKGFTSRQASLIMSACHDEDDYLDTFNNNVYQHALELDSRVLIKIKSINC